jgi:predicted esterase
VSAPTHVHEGQPWLFAGAPLGESPVVVVLLHGRNSSAENILALATRLERPAVTFLAPAAANHTWYPYSFLTEIAKNEPDLSSALAVLRGIVARLEAAGIRREHIVLGGFSQGACLSLEFVARHAGRWGGVLAFSGGLIGPPGTRWPETGTFEGTPMFLGCSDVDSHIPNTRVEESAAVFEGMGAAVTMRLYPGMGHVINDDEIERGRVLIDEVLARARRHP